MKIAGVQPDVITYTSLIDALDRGGQPRRAYMAYAELQQRGLQPDKQLFTMLLSMCSKAGQWKAALQLFHHMEIQGVQPDLIAYNALIAALARGGWPMLEVGWVKAEFEASGPHRLLHEGSMEKSPRREVVR